MSSLTFNEWLARQIAAEYGKSREVWNSFVCEEIINALTNVQLLDYFAQYQLEMGQV